MAQSSMHYDLSVESLSTILAHSLKHPTSFVFGALIGRCDDKIEGVKILHAIPIFHSIPLQPLIGIALEQVNLYVAELNKEHIDLKLLGIYFATEFSEDKGIPNCIKSIACHLSKTPGSQTTVIELKAPNKSCDATSLSLYTCDGKELKLLYSKCSPSMDLADIISSKTRLGSTGHMALCDFESTLENIGLEWLNVVPKKIPQYLYIPGLFA